MALSALWGNSSSNVELRHPQHPTVVFVLGGPGSGKGTTCDRISNEFEFTHISVSELQANVHSEPASATKISLIRKSMNATSAMNYIIDDFPGNVDDLFEWNKMMGHCTIGFVLVLECPDPALQDRSMNANNDCIIEEIKNRITYYHQRTEMVIDKMKKESVLNVYVVHSDRDKDSVYRDIRPFFKKIGARSCLENGGASEDSKARTSSTTENDPTLALIYEAPDGFRGTYDQVLAHEAELDEIERRKTNSVVSVMHTSEAPDS
jgi:UMP-CMP kinase